MGLYPQDRSVIPADTERIGKLLLGEDNLYRMVGDQLNDLVVDEDFVVLYKLIGGPATSPVILSLVTIFQMMEKLPDRQAAEAVRMRLDWKYALHLPLDDPGFFFTTLSHFRARLLAGGAEYLVFNRLVERLIQLGFIRKGGKQRTDSTHILSAVAKLNQIQLVWETLRVGLTALQEQEATWVQEHVPANFLERYLLRRTDYQLTHSEVAAELKQVGADGAWLLKQCLPIFDQIAQVALLRQVWAQQFVVDEQGQSGQPRTKVDGGGLIQTPHDPEVRYSEKRGKGWQGFKGQLSETAEEKGTTNFITDVDVTDAQLVDVKAVPAIQQRLIEREIPPSEQIVDQAYVSTDQMAASHDNGICLFGPLPQTPRNGLFPGSAFQFDFIEKRAVCPANATSQYGALSELTDGSKEYTFAFGKQCRTCPLQAQCTKAKNGRTVRYNVHHLYLEERQAEMQTAAFWEEMKLRPPIEGTLSQVVHMGGRQARYIGVPKIRLQWIFTAVAINLRRLASVLARKTGAVGVPC